MQRLEIDRVVGERVADANARLAVAVHVPRQTGAWTKVVLVDWIQLIEAAAQANEPLAGDEQRGEIVRFLQRRDDVVPETEADRHARRGLPVVVDVDAEGVLRHVARSRAER